MGRMPFPKEAYVCCSECFSEAGLRYMVRRSGTADSATCKRCGKAGHPKLVWNDLVNVAYGFFVRGSVERFEYGAAPRLELNDLNEGDTFEGALGQDAHLLREITNLRVFHYGPNLWMLGQIEPLRDLRSTARRGKTIDRILCEYPEKILPSGSELFRLRVNPDDPTDENQYDSPPASILGMGRFCRPSKPVMYASQDLETCIHEVRATAEDRLFAATLRCERDLRLLDLSAVLVENVTDFESLDLAVLFIFLAGRHAYDITRDIAEAAQGAGYDGIVYPSYFSRLRSGAETIATVYGMSARGTGRMLDQEDSKVIRNLVLFGRPLKKRTLTAVGINRVLLEKVEYAVTLGPVGF